MKWCSSHRGCRTQSRPRAATAARLQHGRPREPRVSLSFNYHGVPYAPAELDEFEDVRLVQAEATSSFHVPDVEKPATLEDVGQGKARHGKAKGFARQGMAIVCVSGPCDD